MSTICRHWRGGALSISVVRGKRGGWISSSERDPSSSSSTSFKFVFGRFNSVNIKQQFHHESRKFQCFDNVSSVVAWISKSALTHPVYATKTTGARLIYISKAGRLRRGCVAPRRKPPRYQIGLPRRSSSARAPACKSRPTFAMLIPETSNIISPSFGYLDY
jgi:hypothetical protein